MRYHERPAGLDEGMLHPSIIVQLGDGTQFVAIETRHLSDGWVVRVRPTYTEATMWIWADEVKVIRPRLS